MKKSKLQKIKNDKFKIEKGLKLTFCEKLRQELTFKNKKKRKKDEQRRKNIKLLQHQ